jgi:hypothetical protein
VSASSRCLKIWDLPIRSDTKRMVPLSSVHAEGKLSLSLDVRRFGESRRVPFSLSVSMLPPNSRLTLLFRVF